MPAAVTQKFVADPISLYRAIAPERRAASALPSTRRPKGLAGRVCACFLSPSVDIESFFFLILVEEEYIYIGSNLILLEQQRRAKKQDDETEING